MGEKRERKGLLLTAKIVSLLVYLAITVLLLVIRIDIAKLPYKEEKAEMIKFALIILLVIGSPCYIFAAIWGIIGFAVSMTTKSSLHNKIFFAIITLLSILTELVWFFGILYRYR